MPNTRTHNIFAVQNRLEHLIAVGNFIPYFELINELFENFPLILPFKPDNNRFARQNLHQRHKCPFIRVRA